MTVSCTVGQFQGIRVAVTNGSQLVQFVWKLGIGAITGTFVTGEAITWGVDGVGVYYSDGGDSTYIYFTMTSGTEPALGDTISASGSGASVTISSFPPTSFPDFAGNPPRFADSPDQGAIATANVVSIAGEPHGEVGATGDIGRYSFKLAANWGGNTYDSSTAPTGVEAVIVRDFTGYLTLPLPTQSGKLAAPTIRRALNLIDDEAQTLATLIAQVGAVQADPLQLTSAGTTGALDDSDDSGLTGREVKDGSGTQLRAQLTIPDDGTHFLLAFAHVSAQENTTFTGTADHVARLFWREDTGGGYGSWTELTKGFLTRQNVSAYQAACEWALLGFIETPDNSATYQVEATVKMASSFTATAQGQGPSEIVLLGIPLGNTANVPEDWNALGTIASPFSNKSGEATLAYYYDAETDLVHLKGVLEASGSATNGQDVVTAANGLPAGRRPSETMTFDAGGELIAIQTDGSITFEGVTGTPGDLIFNGLTIRP